MRKHRNSQPESVAQELKQLGFAPGVHPIDFVLHTAAMRQEKVEVTRTTDDLGPGVFALFIKDYNRPNYAILVHPNDPVIEIRSMWHEASHYYLRHPLKQIFLGAQEYLGHGKGWVVADEYDAEAEAWGAQAYHFSLGIGADDNLVRGLEPERSDADDPYGAFMGQRFSTFLKRERRG